MVVLHRKDVKTDMSFIGCFFVALLFVVSGCYHQQGNEYIVAVCREEMMEISVPVAFINQDGDTVIPFGKFRCWQTDTIRKYGFVLTESDSRLIAIDKSGKELFEAYIFDNGPDYTQEGLFRIMKNGKVGFANEEGQVVIPPQFACAFPFENGKAKVTFTCNVIPDGEYHISKSDTWFFINKSGNKIPDSLIIK